jgi:hypothetical protein
MCVSVHIQMHTERTQYFLLEYKNLVSPLRTFYTFGLTKIAIIIMKYFCLITFF